MLTRIILLLREYWYIATPIILGIYFLRNKYYNGLNKYPGPSIAGYTNWWRFFETLNRRTEKTSIELHRKHGDIVRLGPNVLSFADPRAIKIIYGLNRGFTKSEFYPVQSATSKGKRLPSLFSSTDETFHARYRRCVNSVFAMTSLVSYEPLVDKTIASFLSKTEELFANKNASCNFSQWLQFFAFDVIGQLTWSQHIGFVEKNEDVSGIIEFVAWFLSYAGPIGQMPVLDSILQKNVIKLQLQKWGVLSSVFPATKFALERSAERAEDMKEIKEKGIPAVRRDSGLDTEINGGIDLLSKFTQAQHDHPDVMTDDLVLTSCLSMIFAGSETTAISLSSVFYYLLKTPRVYAKLMRELDEAVGNGKIHDRGKDGLVTWSESQKLPYLDAVIQEAFRMHPAPGLLMERVTPPQGIDILGEFIPGGTIVGCNAWVIHRCPNVFGQDVDTYRPERWIESSQEQLKEMKAAMFQFGAGARTCIGKNISLLEIYKLVPSFLRRFEIEFENPNKDWTTYNAWFVRQLGFTAKFKRRSIMSM